MEVPAYYLRRPQAEADPEIIAAFERLYQEFVAPGTGAEIDYQLAAPKWQFLCYLGDHKNVLLHGSAQPDIAEFEPRQSNDIEEFGNRQAVYASSDAIWSMYFAIVDRDKINLLMNASFRVLDAEGGRSEPYYWFSVDKDALPSYPYLNGTIYLIPGATFEHQANRLDQSGITVESAQWASLVAVKPLAKLTVTPEDFPFLDQMRGHDLAVIQKRAAENPTGFPWLDE